MQDSGAGAVITQRRGAFFCPGDGEGASQRRGQSVRGVSCNDEVRKPKGMECAKIQ